MFRSKIPRMFNYKKSTKQIKNKPRATMNLKNFSSSSFFLGAERDSLKKWIPIMEMEYRGAVYWDWCQGGLPEGKGHLIFEDGRMYDGMWCYGKRSGTGRFYFNHGGVFQGSWRDDVIHGKGCFYFHTRDRWFAAFGRERPVEKVASIQSLVISVLAISKMGSDMITSFVLILMEQGPCTRFAMELFSISTDLQ
ncbi:hypothetical protein NC652_021539 [Populus alba x Populus x berolinensis]|nr:hypothetical protein NC652_021539 [Populus alba x Populus x berolinensis]